MLSQGVRTSLAWVPHPDFRAAAETLGDAGLVVTEAADGEKAIRLLEGGGYDLLVTDVQMPGHLDGVVVARHARERYGDMPIVFATGRADSVRALGNLRDCEILVAKPYGPEQILAAIRRVLGFAADGKAVAGPGSGQPRAGRGAAV